MTESTAVETTTDSLPALAPTPAVEVDGSDITLPRLYIAQDLSAAVQEGNAKKGDIYIANGQDDPDPIVLWSPPEDGEDAAEGVLIQIIGIYKSWSLSEDGDFETWAFTDPDRDPKAWKTYNFTAYADEVDKQVPLKFSWTKSQTAAAKVINTKLVKEAAAGPPHVHGFRVTTYQKANPKGKGTYSVPRVTPAQVTDEQIQLAGNLASLLSNDAPEAAAEGNAPAI